jgi:ABC-type bacteriocin/lantibiotic exporter with double-glycine peptidase domain
LSYAQNVSGISAQLQERAANVDHIRSIVERWHASAQPAGTRPCPRVREVAIDAVDYTYPGRHQSALTDISLVVAHGEQIGIVGPTAAGKSTLAGIVLGLLRPDRGMVLIDGVGALRGHATVIVIAHRLSTLNSCERVAVLDGGRLTALGKPAELEAAGGYYHRALELSALRR